MGGKRKVKEKLKYVPLASKLLFLAIAGAIVYREREDLHRFCRYPFPFIMCPVCDYPCFFQTYGLQLKIVLGAAVTGLVGGRVFCGGICPVGTLQDWLNSLKRLVLSLFRSLKRSVFSSNVSRSKGASVNWRRLQGTLERGLRLFKYPLLLLVFLYSLIRFAMAFDFMPEWGLIPAMRFTVEIRGLAGRGYMNFWLVFLVVAFGAGIILHRPWCKYLCPYGLLFAFFNKISFLKIKLGKKGCTGRTKCLENCTTGKPLSKLEKGFDSMECVRCYDCVLSCPEGAVKIKPRISK
ncbi:4Fe-4S binding protein [Dehalococcoidia bacterium]|nr:4Fe-4S binding protein [Dehalococcoidia bacterium]